MIVVCGIIFVNQEESTVHPLSESEFSEKVEKSETPVLVDFSADWCPPCKMLHPVIEKISQEYGERLRVYEVNTDQSPGLARKFSITSVPTIIFFKNGSAVKQIIGFREYDSLKNVVESIL